MYPELMHEVSRQRIDELHRHAARARFARRVSARASLRTARGSLGLAAVVVKRLVSRPA